MVTKFVSWWLGLIGHLIIYSNATYNFADNEKFWVWMKPLNRIGDSMTVYSIPGAARYSDQNMRFNERCEWFEYNNGKLKCKYDPNFHGNGIDNSYDIEVKINLLQREPLGNHKVIEVKNVKLKPRKLESERGRKSVHLWIRKIEDDNNKIIYVIPDDVEAHSAHKEIFQNCEHILNDPAGNFDALNQKSIFNLIEVVRETDLNLNDILSNNPNRLIIFGNNLWSNQNNGYGPLYANKGSDIPNDNTDGFVEMRLQQNRFLGQLHTELQSTSVYNDYWPIFSRNLDRVFGNDQETNKPFWCSKYKDELDSLLSSNAWSSVGMDWWNPLFGNIVLEPLLIQDIPKYHWVFDRREPFNDGGLTENSGRGIYKYTLHSDNTVILHVVSIEHGPNPTFSNAFRTALEDTTGLLNQPDVIMVEYDMYRLTNEFKEMQKKAKAIYDACLPRISNQREKQQCKDSVIELFGITTYDITEDYDINKDFADISGLDKWIPLTVANRRNVPFIPADVASPLMLARFLKQGTRRARSIGYERSEIRDNSKVVELYDAIWVTQRNHHMVNMINSAVKKYYTDPDSNKKKKFVIIVGPNHYTSQIERTRGREGFYKLGMHQILIKPNFGEQVMNANYKPTCYVAPYTTEFGESVDAAIRAGHVAHSYTDYHNKYQKYMIDRNDKKNNNRIPDKSFMIIYDGNYTNESHVHALNATFILLLMIITTVVCYGIYCGFCALSGCLIGFVASKNKTIIESIKGDFV